ncbi:glycosyltransferase [[Clostridium] innocuum]|nr:glycosyltransferase [[Clostridium] innocuum]MCR0575983.1 glycosyltransferase [[Clostridium] innocuum]
MRVCVIRNADTSTNSNMMRAALAIHEGQNEVIFLSRNRKAHERKGFKKDTIDIQGQTFVDYTIQMNGKMGQGIKNLTNVFRYEFEVFKWLRKNRKLFDYIHVFDLDAGLPVMLFAKLFRKKYIYHIADFYADSKDGIPRRLYGMVKKAEFSVIDHAEATIICLEKRKEQIQGSHPKNLVVVHNTPVMSCIPQSDSKKIPGKLHVCYTGNLAKRRFVDKLLDLAENDKNVILDVAGLGEEEIEKRCEKLAKSNENIHYYGYVKYEEAVKLGASADVIAAIYDPNIKNHKYSAPNKVYEAIMMNKPILVARNSGIDELVEKEKIGYIADYDIESVKKLIEELKQKPDFSDIEKHCKEAYKTYCWKEMKKRIQNIYQELD